MSRHKIIRLIPRVLGKFLGPGLLVAIGYMDPGNWVTSLSAGSRFQYACLFCILLSNIFAMVLQANSVKLGVVTGLDLAQQIKRHVNPVYNILLYIPAELAIIACDIAEVIGSAVALELLIGVNTITGILLSGVYVFVVLLGFNIDKIKPFEILVLLIVIAIGACFTFLIIVSKPVFIDILKGFVPTPQLIGNPSMLHIFVAILGATVMPHNLYLHTHLVQAKFRPPAFDPESDMSADLMSSTPKQSDININTENDTLSDYNSSHNPGISKQDSLRTLRFNTVDRAVSDGNYKHTSFLHKATQFIKTQLKKIPKVGLNVDNPIVLSSTYLNTRESLRMVPVEMESNLEKCNKTLQIDSCLSLLYAFYISCAILIVSASVFTKIKGGDIDLYDAFYSLKKTLGPSVATIYAIALMLCGQSSTLAGTIAGQVVMCGHLGDSWAKKVSPWLRRLITRVIAMVPAIIISVLMGPSGINKLLVWSQIILSIQLPLAMWPLVIMTSIKKTMTVAYYKIGTRSPSGDPLNETNLREDLSSFPDKPKPLTPEYNFAQTLPEHVSIVKTKCYANSLTTKVILILISLQITILNVILIFQELS